MIFIDTGAFIARYFPRDSYHNEAMKLWESLRGKQLYVSNFVLDELLTYLGRITGSRYVAEKVKKIYASTSFQILRPGIGDEIAAIELFEKFQDQNISFTDCISFALMKRYSIKKVFSFDRYFTMAGFDMLYFQ